MTTLEIIESWKAQAEAATEGPWKIIACRMRDGKDHRNEYNYHEDIRSSKGLMWCAEPFERTKEDIDFIAASRTRFPKLCEALIDILRELQEGIDELRKDGDLDGVAAGEEVLARIAAILEAE